MKNNFFVFLCIFCLILGLSSCYKNSNSQQVETAVTVPTWFDENTEITDAYQAEPDTPAPSEPFELWNGFATDMNIEQVIEKAKQSLQVTQTPLDSSNNWRGEFDLTELPGIGPIQFTQGSSADRIVDNRSFIILGSNDEEVSFISTTKVKELGYQCVKVASPMPSYLQEKYGAGGIIENILFYFYQDNLFAVIIRWDRNIETGKLLVERYGDCTAIMNSISRGKIYQTWAVWKLNDRLIYSYITGGTREPTTCYISRNYIERAIEDFDLREANEEARRKAAIEGAIF